VFDAITLQSTEIVTVSQIIEELFEDGPVPIPASRAEFTFEVTLQVVLNAVVVE
jgi:hypothetical protein